MVEQNPTPGGSPIARGLQHAIEIQKALTPPTIGATTAGRQGILATTQTMKTVSSVLAQLLEDNDFLVWASQNLQIVSGAVRGNKQNLEEFQQHVPGTVLNSFLYIQRGAEFIAGRQRGRTVNPYRSDLNQLWKTLSDPAILIVLGFVREINFPLTRLLADVRHNVIVGNKREGIHLVEILTRIADKTFTGNDLKSLFIYVHSVLGKDFTIDPKSKNFQNLMATNKDIGSLSPYLDVIKLIKVDQSAQMTFELGPKFQLSKGQATKSMAIHLPATSTKSVIENLRVALATWPQSFDLDIGSVNILAAHPQILTKVQSLDLQAIADLAADIPISPVQKFLQIILRLRPVLGDDAVKRLLSPFLKSLAPILTSLHDALSKPALAAIIKFSDQVDVPFDVLLNDICTGKFGSDLLIALIDKKLTPIKIQKLFKYLQANTTNKKHILVIHPSSHAFRDTLSAAPHSENLRRTKVTKVIDSITIGKSLKPVFHYDRETLQQFHPVNIPPSGKSTTAEFHHALNIFPPGFATLLQNNEFLAKLILARPGLLTGVANLDLNALEEFQQILGPVSDESQLKALIEFALQVRVVLSDKTAQEALRPILAPIQQALKDMDTALSNPLISATLKVAVGAGLPLATLLTDIRNEKPPFTADRLENLEKGTTSAADVEAFLSYFKSHAGKQLAINVNDETRALLSSLFPGPAGAHFDGLEKIVIDNDKRSSIHFVMKPGHEVVSKLGHLSFSFAFDGALVLNSKATKGAPAVTIKADFGTLTNFIFAGTKIEVANQGLNVFLNILLILVKFLLAPLLGAIGLIGDAIGTSIQLVDINGEKHLRLHTFGSNIVDQKQ